MFVTSFRSFLRDEFGAVTIEFVTLVPMFILMLIFFTDLSIVYLTRTEMWNTARDISRRMSTGEIATLDQVEAYAASKLFLGQRAYTVVAGFNGDRTITIEVPMASAAIFGAWLRPVIGDTLSASATMGIEPFSFTFGPPETPPA